MDATNLSLSNMHASQHPNDFYSLNMKTSDFLLFGVLAGVPAKTTLEVQIRRRRRLSDKQLKSIKIDVQSGWFLIFTTHENGVKTRTQGLIGAPIKSGSVRSILLKVEMKGIEVND